MELGKLVFMKFSISFSLAKVKVLLVLRTTKTLLMLVLTLPTKDRLAADGVVGVVGVVASILQVDEHPSPEMVFPSSQVSGA